MEKLNELAVKILVEKIGELKGKLKNTEENHRKEIEALKQSFSQTKPQKTTAEESQIY